MTINKLPSTPVTVTASTEAAAPAETVLGSTPLERVAPADAQPLDLFEAYGNAEGTKPPSVGTKPPPPEGGTVSEPASVAALLVKMILNKQEFTSEDLQAILSDEDGRAYFFKAVAALTKKEPGRLDQIYRAIEAANPLLTPEDREAILPYIIGDSRQADCLREALGEGGSELMTEEEVFGPAPSEDNPVAA